MPQLLLEFFSEEIPARMQKRAEEDLAKLFGEKLKAAGLEPKAIKTFSTPRRLGLVIDDLPAKAADVNEEKKGPRVGAPDQAIQGFLKSANLASLKDAKIVSDKKGDFYIAQIERKGRETSAIVQEITPDIVRAFPWPKSMRSGSSDLQWVRPLHNVLALFDGAPVKIEIEGVGAKPQTLGHRFHAPAPITPKDFADYAAKLREARVLIDRDERKAIILEQAKKLCVAKGLELVDDAGLLEEVAGLVEWPVTLLGDMDPAFLDLPGEVIRLSMRTHQKYFAVRDPKTQKLAPHFITVANVQAKDGGKAIAAGNARVLSARLNDARFFWDTDRKTPLFTEERKAKLEKIVFHQKLGSVWDKVERVKALAVELCAVTGADAALVKRAADLCKMDLVTETVGEFPELQGQIGRQLHLAQSASSSMEEAPRSGGGGAHSVLKDEPNGARSSSAARTPPQSALRADSSSIEEEQSVAAAIEDHYRPLGPNDRVPSDPVAVTLALADKLDTLVGFWAIDEKPTGSSDPYALRRAALGVIRTLLDESRRLSFSKGLIERTIIKLVDQENDRLQREESFLSLEKRYLAEDISVLERLLLDHDGLLSRSAEIIRKREWENDNREAVLSEVERADADLAIEALRARGRQIEDAKSFYSRITWGKRSSVFPFGERTYPETPEVIVDFAQVLVRSLLAFLADRLKVQLRDQGKRHDLVDAVFALGDDDLVRIVARVEALDAFLKTQDGANLLAGYKRAANILAAEEKKGKGLGDTDKLFIDGNLLKEPAEKALLAALQDAIPKAKAAVEKEDFAAAMKALAGLRAPVDAFFDGVMVNAEDASLRRNRLLLLARLREALSQVADFSKIEG